MTELHLVSTMPGLSPHTLLLLDLEQPCDSPMLFPLTLTQASELCASLEKLLAAAASA